MKTGLEPSLPGRPGIGGLREESAGRVEKPHAGFQPLTALDAAVLAGRDRISRPLGESGCPVCLQFPAQALGAFHDQRGDRRPQPVPVQSTQHPRSQATQPTMQRGGVRMSHSHAPDCLSKAGGVLRRLQIRRAGRLNHRPRVALVGDELNRQDAQAPLAYGADALRHRCLAVLHPTMPWPTGTPCDKPASINQRANRQAIRTRNLLADRFTFDSCGQQGIIGDGDGNWDSTLSVSPRGTGARTPVPHFFQKALTLPLQPPPRKQVVHNRALMSMSFSLFSSEHPEPVRRVLPVSLRCH